MSSSSGAQEYLNPNAYFDSDGEYRSGVSRARSAATSIKLCKDRKLEAAGFLQHDAGFTAVANTRGLKGYHRSSGVDFSVTVRTPDGQGSGYGICDFNDAKKLDTAQRLGGCGRESSAFASRRARSSPANTRSFSSLPRRSI